MSQPLPHSVSCPKCGAGIDFTLWRSIDTTEEDAVRKLVSGSLFRLTCPACGGSTVADYPMLVNDPSSGMLIWYAAEWELPNVRQIIDSGKYIHRLRVVDSQTALREKTAIFSELLDDRVIEILKVVTLERMAPTADGKSVGDIWYVNRDGKRRFEVSTDGRIACYDLDMAVYDSLRTIVSGLLLKEGDTPRVDRVWAEAFLLQCGSDLFADEPLDPPTDDQ